jgi:hypothetical protein
MFCRLLLVLLVLQSINGIRIILITQQQNCNFRRNQFYLYSSLNNGRNYITIALLPYLLEDVQQLNQTRQL